MATHSSVLAWRIPGTGEPGGLPSMGSHRVRHDWSDLAAATAAFPKLRQANKIIKSNKNKTMRMIILVFFFFFNFQKTKRKYKKTVGKKGIGNLIVIK